MNRLKFRTFDPESNEMQVFNLQDIAENYSCPEGYFMGRGVMGFRGLAFDVLQKSEIMQFTGLIDRNGKEIFEGDIVKSAGYEKDCIEVVEWNKIGWSPWSENNLLEGIGFVAKNYEVIGNIYQTPELRP